LDGLSALVTLTGAAFTDTVHPLPTDFDRLAESGKSLKERLLFSSLVCFLLLGAEDALDEGTADIPDDSRVATSRMAVGDRFLLLSDVSTQASTGILPGEIAAS
jgi:hypothetical protein